MTEAVITDLPELDERQLSHSPLDLVVCQVRFENSLSVADARVALAFHESIGGREGEYSEASQVEASNVNVNIGPGAPQVSTTGLTGWRFTSPENSWIVSLMPDHVSVETSAYTNWADDFRPRLQAILTAADQHVGPRSEKRVGLRYVDRLVDLPVETPSDWREHIREPLIGPLIDDQFGPGVLAARQHLLLAVTEEIRCGLGHGFLVDPDEGKPVYLLDYDLFREGSRAFNLDEIVKLTDELNQFAVRLFHASVRPELLERLR